MWTPGPSMTYITITENNSTSAETPADQTTVPLSLDQLTAMLTSSAWTEFE
jgi:hypothetical protein